MLLKTSVTNSQDPIQRPDPAHPLMSPVVAAPKAKRIAFYSHDTMGMGHIRRNLLIASSLVRNTPGVEALLIAGTREAAFFAAQTGLDCITLPALAKDLNGGYSARHLGWSLEQTVRLRSRIIAAAMDEFRPDIFVVDKLPLGIGNELSPTLEQLKSRPTHCVLGLRDVLDEPQVVAREWQRDNHEASIQAYFNELWIYGDRAIYDCVDEYKFSQQIASRAYFTGYLNQSQRSTIGAYPTGDELSHLRETPFALCVVGGGQDGFALAQAFVQADLPAGWRGVVITGPFMPKQDQATLQQLIAHRTDIEIIDQMVETDDYLRHATRVIAMGGYNTVTSVLSFGKPALIVPRTRPRREQWIRAERLARLGWISAVAPEALTTACLSDWLNLRHAPRPIPGCVDLLGLNRIGSRVDHLCANHVTL